MAEFDEDKMFRDLLNAIDIDRYEDSVPVALSEFARSNFICIEIDT